MRLLAFVLVLVSGFALAQTPSRVPSKMVLHTNAAITVDYGPYDLLSIGLDWVDAHWPTNINITSQYWTAAAQQSYQTNVSTQFLNLAKTYLRGTNFEDAVLGTDSVWRIDWTGHSNVVELADMVTMYGTWGSEMMTNGEIAGSVPDGTPLAIPFTNWHIAAGPYGVMTVGDGVVYAPSGYVAILQGSGKIKINSRSNCTSRLRFYDSGDAGLVGRGIVVGYYQESSTSNQEGKVIWGGATFAYPTASTGSVFSTWYEAGAATYFQGACGGEWHRWDVLLYHNIVR